MNERPHRRRGAAVLACATLLGAQAGAQEADWTGSIGLGARVAPLYEGSEETETTAAPLLSLNYGRVALAGRELSVTAFRTEGFSLAVTAGYDGGRDSEDLSFDGMSDIEDSARLGLRAGLRSGGTRFTAEAWRYLDETEGAQVSLGLGQTVPVSSRLILNAGISASWASEDYMEGYFGITPEQALSTGQPIYGLDAGFRAVSLDLRSAYALSKNLHLITSVTVSRYGDEVQDSVLVEDGTPISGAVFLAYRF